MNNKKINMHSLRKTTFLRLAISSSNKNKSINNISNQ